MSNNFRKNRILIGLQPTGKLHIGNYLGCIKKGLEYQSEGKEVIFMIANYHMMTTIDHDTDKVKNTYDELLRLGCKNIVLQNAENLHMFYSLTCKLNVGTLQRMPQYKDKKEETEYDLGLLLYPVLMAADIIVNDPDIIIVGKDQVPHIELCNDIAKRVGRNKYYNYEFGHVDKVNSLIDPTKKMSKSAGENHVLYLFDEDYEKKLRKATATEEGLKNLHLIGNSLGLNCNQFSLNSELKSAIAGKMQELFGQLQVTV